METIWSAALGAPWWVYALLVYLLFIGIKASKTRVVSIQQLFILPIIFSVAFLSLLRLQASAISIGGWGVAVLTGISIGWALANRLSVKVDKKQRLLEIPGTWSTLLIILTIFASKYYIGYRLDVNPSLSTDSSFQVWPLSISRLCMGLLLGRWFCFLNRFRMEAHTHLEKT